MQLREGPIGRLIPGTRPEGAAGAAPASSRPEDLKKEEAKPPSLVDQAKHALEDWQHQIDERVKAVLPIFMPWQQLQHEVKRLSQRIEELEAKLKSATTNTSGHSNSTKNKPE